MRAVARSSPSPAAAAVAMALVGRRLWNASVPAIAAAAGVGERSVRRALAELTSSTLLTRKCKPGGPTVNSPSTPGKIDRGPLAKSPTHCEKDRGPATEAIYPNDPPLPPKGGIPPTPLEAQWRARGGDTSGPLPVPELAALLARYPALGACCRGDWLGWADRLRGMLLVTKYGAQLTLADVEGDVAAVVAGMDPAQTAGDVAKWIAAKLRRRGQGQLTPLAKARSSRQHWVQDCADSELPPEVRELFAEATAAEVANG